MAVTNFVPSIWNAQMLLDFREQAIAAALANREYEGDATKGNTVKVTSATAVAIKDYKAAGRTTSADAVSSTQIDLLIDNEKNFDFKVDDIDRAQAAGSMDAFTRSAGEGLAEDADKFILSKAVAEAGSAVTQPTAAITTPAQAWNVFRDLRKTLDKNKVPAGNRVAIVNAEFAALLLEAEGKLVAADMSGSTQGLREAVLGKILGFTTFQSENLPTVAKAQVVGFYRPALAYVSQIEETEAMRAQDSFADRLRGLHVYGGKVVRPSAVAAWTNF